MAAGELTFIVFTVLGGLALFIYGMQLMTAGLQALAGSRLRALLGRLTRDRLTGFGAGTALGFLVHSSAGTVMLIGFVNAGLMSLLASIPVVLGANLGTTLSMQLISFKLGKYAFAAIALGLLLKLVSRRDLPTNLGLMLFGFGLLFLGMNTMSGAIVPLKEAGFFEAFLSHTDGSTALGLATGILVATLVTGVIQSSGATIGMLFALAGAGVFTDLANVFPLVIGAHIGTCITAVLGSLGTGIDARRVALSHLLFNLLGAVLAALMAGLYLKLVPMLGGGLTRQIANTHTVVQLFNSAIVLAVLPAFCALVVKLSPSRAVPELPSYLDDALLETPEAAIYAVIRETARMGDLVRRMMRQVMRGLFTVTDAPFARVAKEEASVDLIKEAITDYVMAIGNHRVSVRQARLLQFLVSSASDIERVGDHIETLLELTRLKVAHDVWFDDRSMELLLELYQQADRCIGLVVASLDPDAADFAARSGEVLAARKHYKALTRALRQHQDERISQKADDAFTSTLFSRYLTGFDRIVRHVRRVADVERRGGFELKASRLDRQAEQAGPRPTGQPISVRDSAIFRIDRASMRLEVADEADEPDEPDEELR